MQELFFGVAAADYAVKTLAWEDREMIRLHVSSLVLGSACIKFNALTDRINH